MHFAEQNDLFLSIFCQIIFFLSVNQLHCVYNHIFIFKDLLFVCVCLFVCMHHVCASVHKGQGSLHTSPGTGDAGNFEPCEIDAGY